MTGTTNEAVLALRELAERDHEQQVAMFRQKADAAAADGNERLSADYRRFADRLAAVRPPWQEREG